MLADRFFLVIFISVFLFNPLYAARLAIVIDDFGYRPKTENQILALPATISIAILPNAPYAKQMAEKAHNQGREILIHMPMAPLSKQQLESGTLRPSMTKTEIAQLIKQAIQNVPYAVGINNHMGSAMTADLTAMQHVMNALKGTPYYFLDSMTIGRSKASQAANEIGIPVLRRDIFLDDTQTEQNVRKQLQQAIIFARKHGTAIAIGHPHPVTVKILQQALVELPNDIRLVSISDLLRHQENKIPDILPEPVKEKPLQQCDAELSIEQVNQLVMLHLLRNKYPKLLASATEDELKNNPIQ